MNSTTVLPDFSIKRFCMGDRAEFSRVYDLCFERLRKYAYTIVSKNVEAEDIASETFIKLWYYHSKFESLNQIIAFLYFVARNACIDYLRSQQKHRTVYKEILYLEEYHGSSTNEINNIEIFIELYKKIQSLPGKCRKIFQLIYFNNLSTAEVAARMNISNQNVLNQKARAIQIIRSSLPTPEL